MDLDFSFWLEILAAWRSNKPEKTFLHLHHHPQVRQNEASAWVYSSFSGPNNVVVFPFDFLETKPDKGTLRDIPTCCFGSLDFHLRDPQRLRLKPELKPCKTKAAFKTKPQRYSTFAPFITHLLGSENWSTCCSQTTFFRRRASVTKQVVGVEKHLVLDRQASSRLLPLQMGMDIHWRLVGIMYMGSP